MEAVRIGNLVLDDGHETLARQINALWDYWREATDREGMVAALNAFLGQLRCHFSLEEIILQGAGYPDSEVHAARHQDILHRLTEHRNELSTNNRVRPFDVMQQINALLCEHELTEDSAYWPWLSASQQPSGQPSQTLPDGSCDAGGEPVQRPRRQRASEWHEGHLTGNAQIDAHHRALIQHGDRLAHIAVRSPQETFLTVVREFRALAGHHFQVEEMLLDGRDTQAAQAHRETHRALLRSLDSMIERVRQGRLAPLTFVRDFLTFWMLNHITDSDLSDFSIHSP